MYYWFLKHHHILLRKIIDKYCNQKGEIIVRALDTDGILKIELFLLQNWRKATSLIKKADHWVIMKHVFCINIIFIFANKLFWTNIN